MKCPVCDQLNTSMLCPRCGFDASRDYEKYPTFGIVRNVPAISARQAEQDIGRRTTQQLLSRVEELEHQMRSMTETNRLLLRKLSRIERTVRASAGRKPNRLRADPILPSGLLLYSANSTCTYPVLGSKFLRDQIASVTFLDTLADAPGNAWDVSAGRSGAVRAWAVPDGKLYDLYLAADGVIEAPESCESLFAGYRNMRRIRFGDCFDTFRVRNMGGMFFGCSSLTNLDLSTFDTARVQDMRWMFERCSSLTTLDLRNFDTARVQNMSRMFSNCSSLTNLDLSTFDTARVQDMRWMFERCSSLTTLDLRNFDTARVQNMSRMFSNCSSLTNLDLSTFDTSNVTNMDWMFTGCSSLTKLDLRDFDTSRVQHMDSMFKGCSSLTKLDLRSFNTSKVHYMRWMFKGCSSLTTLKRTRLFVTANAQTDNMFANCPAGK